MELPGKLTGIICFALGQQALVALRTHPRVCRVHLKNMIIYRIEYQTLNV